MKKTIMALKILTALAVIFLLLSCNPLEKDSLSNTVLIVVSITGTDYEGNEANYLQSDVLRVNAETQQQYVTSDSAIATLKAEFLSPDPEATTSFYNNILVTRYVVTYTRSDGRNTPGVDVPYSFEGSLSTLVEIGETSQVSFIVVREVAKLEPPLSNLASGRDVGVLEVKARIDFYGHDMSNHTVKATGYLTIFFTNYIDI